MKHFCPIYQLSPKLDFLKSVSVINKKTNLETLLSFLSTQKCVKFNFIL
jgi:hypothetical protein